MFKKCKKKCNLIPISEIVNTIVKKHDYTIIKNRFTRFSKVNKTRDIGDVLSSLIIIERRPYDVGLLLLKDLRNILNDKWNMRVKDCENMVEDSLIKMRENKNESQKKESKEEKKRIFNNTMDIST